MKNSMKKPFLIGTSLFMVVLIAFVYFSQPIKAKADQPTLNYQTTTASLTEVKAMITGMEAAIVPIVFIVIGFLALTYCTLRNVNVPLEYPSDTSFIDKCSELGHYCFDNATEALKPVIYSVYEFIASGQVIDTSRLSSTLPFLITSVGKFFGAFGTWLSSSFINNVQPIAQGLLDQFKVKYFDNLYINPSIENVQNTFDLYSPVPMFNTLSLQFYLYSSPYYEYYSVGLTKKVGVNYSEYSVLINDIGFFVGKVSNGFFETVNDEVFSTYSSWQYAINRTHNWPDPNLSIYNSVTFGNQTIGTTGVSITPHSLYITRNMNNYKVNQDIVNFLLSLGFTSVLNVAGSDTAYHIAVEDVSVVSTKDIATPWSDNEYYPSDDEIDADIDDVADKLGEGVTIGSLAALIALLTNNKALTLDTALTDVQTINNAGDYNFPSMDNIWKYPQYFFDMLHGWGVFVKGCLGAVTVGEGGLSWIFYGGFVLLICGGIIGKILLG